ncbi:thiamine pyrophosphate-dependent dehydrogenase E1 component subunit alpha [Oceanidesulfovibrio marinus]|uniref:Pyruvate dehydrogenase (Acetyl-transferring) E1 component subunit alpha n=1 Tax=Oceanidesulfovibrio marinus TaxID=370038 RepID=A0A6P1ZG20_9BACT|nr:thiamine pyrophosphate-dependent dehydrogenase E1 component subunit alpha [Oceanidesulfovibrio marinus]TVM31861.1 pyruvate dehydrogenase (acetyl-transferring) E1 component subunit alpha [Oceanidesulfovibrio marinus]
MATAGDAGIRLQILEKMILSRRFEDQITELAEEQGRLPGMQILATGQEAAVAAVLALQDDDVIVTNHRSHAHILARGADPNTLMAEIMGKESGVNHGKSGTLHLIVPEVNVLMTSTVVGAAPPLAAGAAFAQQYTESGAITAVFFGDGAAAEGSVHEAMNLAGVWKLPLLFICENNCWAGAQSYQEHCSVGNIASRAGSYGMPGDLVNGNDADDVFKTALDLAARCREGKGPALMELATYRMHGHGEFDKQHYVDPEELKEWAARDPLTMYRKRLTEEGVATTEQIEAMEQEAARIVEEAVRFAEESPYPAPEAVLDHVWAEARATR